MALVTTKYPDGFSSSVKSLTAVGKRKVDWRAGETITQRFTWEEFIQQWQVVWRWCEIVRHFYDPSLQSGLCTFWRSARHDREAALKAIDRAEKTLIASAGTGQSATVRFVVGQKWQLYNNILLIWASRAWAGKEKNGFSGRKCLQHDLGALMKQTGLPSSSTRRKTKMLQQWRKDHGANIIPWCLHHSSPFSNRRRQPQLRLLIFPFDASIDITYRMTLQRWYNNSLIWDKNLSDCTGGIHRNKCHPLIHTTYNKFIVILAKKSISELQSKFIDLLLLSIQTDFQLNCWIYLKPQVHTSWNVDLIVWKWGNFV